MKPIDLLHLQMKLESIGLDGNGRLIPLLISVEEFPLFLLAQLNDGKTACHFATSLPEELQAVLMELIPDLQFPNIQEIAVLFERYNVPSNIGHFKTYRFPERYQDMVENDAKPFSKYDARIQAFGFGELADTVCAVEQNGMILSACVSSRQDDSSAEAWVMTLPEQRGKGLGSSVVTRWASAIFRAGRIPFYSHEIDNVSSARLAKRLGLFPIFEEIVFG
jgi:RimJ/RimL family protein N-acetyltransferase